MLTGVERREEGEKKRRLYVRVRSQKHARKHMCVMSL